MFAEAKAADLSQFADVIDGSMDASACLVSYGQVPDKVKTALEAAMKALGFTTVYVNCAGHFEVDGGDKNLFACLEGIDPVVMIVVDEWAAALVGKAYKMPLPLDKKVRIMGRDAVVFTSFEGDLEDKAKKQRDWALMKALGRS